MQCRDLVRDPPPRRVYLSNASVHGAFALRACIVNHRTPDADIAAVVEEVMAAAAA